MNLGGFITIGYLLKVPLPTSFTYRELPRREAPRMLSPPPPRCSPLRPPRAPLWGRGRAAVPKRGAPRMPPPPPLLQPQPVRPRLPPCFIFFITGGAGVVLVRCIHSFIVCSTLQPTGARFLAIIRCS